jgi:Carboxypeptidase regulatory-like domain/TonB-dependent Receptor Plug Domain
MSRQQRHPGANVLRILIVLLTMSIFYGTFIQVASAQTSRGTVTGIVRDPNNLVVPGAKVTLTSIETNVSRETLTSEEGFYRFDAVDLGTYKLTFSAEGFSPLENTDITVSANQTAVVDAALKVGAIDISVSVIEDIGVALQVDAPVRGGNITQTQITELPFQSRNPTLLALTFPGVSSSRGFQNSVDNSFSANGARTRSNNFLIDGTENNDISVAGQGFKITNTDAVQEVSIQTSNYDAEFGRSGGAVVNTITKSGTNQFHGTLSYLLDSRVDDAITSSDSRNPDIAKNGLPFGIENIFAATLGGPIEEKKSFFFVAYQEDRKRSNTQQQLIAPTAAGRARLRELFPAGASPNADLYLNATQNTVAVASPFNVALGTVGGVDRGNIEFGSFFRSFGVNDPDKQFQIRTDRQMTQKDNLSVRFLLDRRLIPFGSTILVGPTFEGFDGDNNNRYYNFLIANSHVFSPLFTNETRLAYNRIDLGFPLSDPNGPSGKLPQFAFRSPPSITSLGASPSFPQGRIANNYVVQDTVTLFKSNHTFRGGVDFLRQISTQAAPYSPRGAFTFNASTDFTAFANFIDNFGGSGGTARKDFGSAVYFPALYRTATFFQDRWRATSAVTLTLGMRYEYFGTPFNTLRTPAFTGLFNVDPVTRLGPYALPNKVKADRNNFSPTVGIAYSPFKVSGPLGFLFGEKRSVFRAGYYIGYDSFFNNIASNAATSSPNIISTTSSSAVSGTNPRGLPNFSAISTGPLDPISSQTLMAPDLVNPYYQRWSAGIQRELPHGIVLDISYVGSKGTKLYVTEDANPLLVDPQLRLGTPSPLPADYPNCTPGGTITAAQATSRFPTGTPCPLSGRYDNLQGSRSVRTNGGSSSYHAGQVEVKRRLASNFIVTGAYTYSKLISNMDEVANSTASGISNQNLSQIPFIFGGERLDRAVSLFDRTHRASITYVVESPFMKDQRGVVGHILGGYELSGVTVFESGVPFTVFNGLDSDGIGGSTTDRPNVNPNGRRGVRAKPDANSITGYVNPDDNNAAIDPSTAYFIGNPAYSPGTAGSVPRVGTLGRNTERTPGTSNFDVSILKRTRISESKTVEFRTEFYNIFNHPQYGQGSVSPFSPPGNPNNTSFIPGNINSPTAGFLKANTTDSDGGGRVIRYQLKFTF